MDIKKPVMIMLGLLGVVLTILALQGTVAGDWEEVAGKVTLLIGVIAVLGVVVAVMLGRS